MEYSKLKTIKAVNYRSLGSVEIDMSDNPIVALTGSNEGGKSSIIYAFGTAAGNLKRTKQNQHIRTGTDGFAVLLELEDSTKVLRKKSSSVNSYTLVTPDGNRRDATKIDVDVPDYIEAVMGLFRDPETKECLQVRTCDDPLLFVNTTDGQNYKAMHNAINNLDVREATVKAKADATKLLDEANKKRTEVDIYKAQLAELPLLDTDYLKIIISALERASKISTAFDTANQKAELVATLYGSDVADKLKQCAVVDTDVLRVFTDALRNLEAVKEVTSVNYEAVQIVDATPISLFERALKFKNDVEISPVGDIKAETVNDSAMPLFAKALAYLSDVKACAATAVPETVALVKVEAMSLFDKAFAYVQDITEASESYDKLSAGIKTVTDVLKSSGMRVISCENCGHDMAVPSEV